MSILATLLLTAMTAHIACALEGPPLERPYKVLMLLPVSSWSHRHVFVPVAEALASRGHQVVMLSKFPPSLDHANITELTYWRSIYEERLNFFEIRKHPLIFLARFRSELSSMARDLYNDTTVMELYHARKEFDVVFVDALFNEALYAFAHELPLITISTVGDNYQHSAVMGNFYHPAYVPTPLWDFARPWHLHDKVFNVLFHVISAAFWRFLVVPAIEYEVKRHFPDLPPLLEVERNQSLAFVNSHFSIDLTLPLLPSQVQIGAIHCQPAKPLPQDLAGWVRGAGETGVVYVSLGSMARGDSMPSHHRDLFVRAFARLEQRVIWKYEDVVPGVSDNVMVRRWLPQQDILAHPNVKVFLSHGGLLSLQETIYHATPVLALPIFGDQPKVAALIQNEGYGRRLEWEELTVDLLVDTLQEIIRNPRYLERVAKASKTLRDQPEPARDRAVYWTEYVIRHGGAPHLRSPVTELSWAEFLLLDVLLVLGLAAKGAHMLFRAISRRPWPLAGIKWKLD
ncbi:UDP-glycosyltransferase UGT5-like [Penaeus japonicus]|uniref:UDP-glycosyltransferase UGT5-like n=1 Tax=Penaeus japonicus TaxID=27405 RepID=UPI001C713D0D|nr:UDP-glycosyltransferase UGT5-like [Penaeus japonicus]